MRRLPAPDDRRCVPQIADRTAMDSWSKVIQHCREVTGLSEEERDEQTLDRIDRRKRRAEKRGES